jgi:sortase A
VEAMKARRWITNILLLIGVLGIAVSAGSIAVAIVWQDWESWVFDRNSRDQPATVAGYVADKKDQLVGSVRAWRGLPPVPEPPAAYRAIVPGLARPRAVEQNGILGRLTIERLHLSAMVREGDGEHTLSLALGHIPGTALPGQTGNIGIAGHRDTLFRGLRNVRKADLIEFETLAGSYVYKVASIEIVKPQKVSVLDPGPYPELTLVTCYPFYYIGSAPDRFIVKARQVSAGPSAGRARREQRTIAAGGVVRDVSRGGRSSVTAPQRKAVAAFSPNGRGGPGPPLALLSNLSGTAETVAAPPLAAGPQQVSGAGEGRSGTVPLPRP